MRPYGIINHTSWYCSAGENARKRGRLKHNVKKKIDEDVMNMRDDMEYEKLYNEVNK
jgi:hypothetical protein